MGGFRGAFNGAQDYDLILRCTEKAEHITHIPGSCITGGCTRLRQQIIRPARCMPLMPGKRAIEEHLKRCGETGVVSHTKDLGFYRVQYQMSGNPLVSIIIPNKDHVDMLDKCLRSIQKSSYRNYEVIIVGKITVLEEATFDYYKKNSLRSDPGGILGGHFQLFCHQ